MDVPSRARSLLVFVYLALVAAGMLFTVAPTPSIDAVLYPSSRALAWSLSYVVGGSVALAALLLRLRLPGAVATWYFELGGLALLVMANMTYFVILVRMGLPRASQAEPELGLLGVSLVVLAFGLSLSVRALEAFEHVGIVRQLERREAARGRGHGRGAPGGRA